MKKLKPKQILIIAVAVVVFAALMGILFGKDSPDSKPTETESASVKATNPPDTSEAESTEKDFSSGLIWKDDEKYGIVNLHINGNQTKQSILNDYYMKMSSFLKTLDRADLKDYDHIEFVGNVVQDNKIECTIKGNIDISLIKSNDKLLITDLQDNIKDLFIPKPLQ